MARATLEMLKALGTARAIRGAWVRPFNEGYMLEVDFGNGVEVVEKAHGGVRIFRTIDTPVKLMFEHGLSRVVVENKEHDAWHQRELI